MTSEQQQQAIEAIKKSLESKTPAIQLLVVEDNSQDAEITLSALRSFGLKVEWAQNMAEVLRVLRTIRPWLVFLDLKMVGESGLRILQVIRDFSPETWVVVLTGAYEHDSQECKEALKHGAAFVTLKPLTAQKIQLIFGTPQQ